MHSVPNRNHSKSEPPEAAVAPLNEGGLLCAGVGTFNTGDTLKLEVGFVDEASRFSVFRAHVQIWPTAQASDAE